MKIKNLAITILMITFLIILGTKVEAATGKVNEETVRLRKEPNTSSTILDQLDKNDEVEILEQEDGWYKVKAQTEQGMVTGYISEKLIDVENSTTSNNDENKKTEPEEKPEESVETTTTDVKQENEITTEMPTDTVPEVRPTSNNIEENNQYTIQQEISIKRLPLINSKEKYKITGNIMVVEIINNWVKIESDTQCGWIRKNILKTALSQIVTPPQEEQPQEQPEKEPEKLPEEKPKEPIQDPVTTEPTKLNKVGYVMTEGLRVRKGPSTDSEEITSLSKNDQVEIIGQEGKWYKINIDGETGYISAKYISDTKIAETTSRSGSTLKNEEANQEEVIKQEEEKEIKPEQSTSGTTGAAVVEYAKQYLGYKYVSGGASPSTGFDCSGFTSYVYKNFGISLNRTSGDQIKNGVAVEKSDLQLGDIVLFNNDANTKIGHVGIYVGNGNFIHASNPSDGVKITTLESGYYQKRYVGARRVI